MNRSRSTSTVPASAWILVLVILGSTSAGFAATTDPVDPETAATETIARARELAGVGRCADAILLLNRALEWNADATAARGLRADCLRREQRLDEAWSDYRALASARPEEAHAWFWMGTIDRWRGRHSEAIEEFGYALNSDDGHPDSLKGRARSYLELGRPEAAEADLRRCLREHPNDAEAARLLARAELAQGDLESARDALGAVFVGPQLQLELGSLEDAAGRLGPAAEHYRRASRYQRTEVEALRRLGDAERRRSRDQAALDALRQVVREEPSDLGSLYWVGVLATRDGRNGEALAAWDAILAVEPENVGALIGRARVLHYQGDRRAALNLTNKALDLEPENAEALTLRAGILAATGRLPEAGADYERVLGSDPDNVDARIGYGRYVDSSSWGVRGFTDVSRLVEGLDDEGAVVNGVLIRPTRIEYQFEGVETYWRSHLGAGTGIEATLGQRRETVRNLDGDFEIYDFEILEVSTGLDHRFGGGWQASWRVGGNRYEPRQLGTISEDDRLAGRVALGWAGSRDRVVAEVTQAPFVYRGFAGDTQFSIFDQLSVGARWSRQLAASLQLETSASVSDFEQDENQLFGNLAFSWQRGGRRAVVGVRQTPFPERFLTEDGRLNFLDSTAAYARLDSRLGAGFRVEAISEYGRIGSAPRLIEIDGQKVDGPSERNTRVYGRAVVEWSPRKMRRLSLGTAYSTERFDFRSAVYNTIDTDGTTFYVDLTGGQGTRFHYSARYGRSLMSDDRDDSYDRDDVYLRLEGEVGRSPAPGVRSLWLGLEGRFSQNTLEGSTESYDEERPYLRLYLKIPI